MVLARKNVPLLCQMKWAEEEGDMNRKNCLKQVHTLQKTSLR